MTKSNGSAKQAQNPPASKDTLVATPHRSRAIAQAKIVPLQKRLGRLRKEEAKRQRQLERVQAKAVKTSAELSRVLESISAWLNQPETTAGPVADAIGEKAGSKS